MIKCADDDPQANKGCQDLHDHLFWVLHRSSRSYVAFWWLVVSRRALTVNKSTGLRKGGKFKIFNRCLGNFGEQLFIHLSFEWGFVVKSIFRMKNTIGTVLQVHYNMQFFGITSLLAPKKIPNPDE